MVALQVSHSNSVLGCERGSLRRLIRKRANAFSGAMTTTTCSNRVIAESLLRQPRRGAPGGDKNAHPNAPKLRHPRFASEDVS
jgi:hypothetical protein